MPLSLTQSYKSTLDEHLPNLKPLSLGAQESSQNYLPVSDDDPSLNDLYLTLLRVQVGRILDRNITWTTSDKFLNKMGVLVNNLPEIYDAMVLTYQEALKRLVREVLNSNSYSIKFRVAQLSVVSMTSLSFYHKTRVD